MNNINNFEQFINYLESETCQIHDKDVKMTIAQLNLRYRKRTHSYHGTIRLKHSTFVIPNHIPEWASNNFGWVTLSQHLLKSEHEVNFYLNEWPGLDRMTTLLLLQSHQPRFNYYGNYNFNGCYDLRSPGVYFKH